jgi:hypothetical protein
LDRGERICNKADENGLVYGMSYEKLEWYTGITPKKDTAVLELHCAKMLSSGLWRSNMYLVLGGRSYVALGAPLYALNKNLMYPIPGARKAATSCCRCSAVGSTREKTNGLENTEIVSSKVDFQVDRTRLKPQSAQCARIPALSEHLQRLDYFL